MASTARRSSRATPSCSMSRRSLAIRPSASPHCVSATTGVQNPPAVGPWPRPTARMRSSAPTKATAFGRRSRPSARPGRAGPAGASFALPVPRRRGRAPGGRPGRAPAPWHPPRRRPAAGPGVPPVTPRPGYGARWPAPAVGADAEAEGRRLRRPEEHENEGVRPGQEQQHRQGHDARHGPYQDQGDPIDERAPVARGVRRTAATRPAGGWSPGPPATAPCVRGRRPTRPCGDRLAVTTHADHGRGIPGSEEIPQDRGRHGDGNPVALSFQEPPLTLAHRVRDQFRARRSGSAPGQAEAPGPRPCTTRTSLWIPHCGSASTSRCTWSGMPSISITSAPRSAPTERTMALSRSSTPSTSTLHGFGTPHSVVLAPEHHVAVRPRRRTHVRMPRRVAAECNANQLLQRPDGNGSPHA